MYLVTVEAWTFHQLVSWLGDNSESLALPPVQA